MLKPLLTIAWMVSALWITVQSGEDEVEGRASSEIHVDERSSGGGDGSPLSWWQILLIVACCLCVVLCCLLCCFKKYWRGKRDFVPVKTETTVICHLCLEKISWSEWDSGRHRAKCEEENEYFLKSLSKAKNIHCPNCGERMRQWLKMGPGFNCNEEGCERNNFFIINNGKNRFNCFKCDFDFCGDCVKKKIAKDDAKPIYSLKHKEGPVFNSPTLPNDMSCEIESKKATHESPVDTNNLPFTIELTNNNDNNNITIGDISTYTVPYINSSIQKLSSNDKLPFSDKLTSIDTLAHNTNPFSATLPHNINPDKTNFQNNNPSRASVPYNMHLNDNPTFITPPAIPWATYPIGESIPSDSKEGHAESFFA